MPVWMLAVGALAYGERPTRRQLAGAALGLAGGAVYDGLVAATAREHRLPLITCDRRAESTYRALGVNYELLRR
jgi:predicted nucleic acid-binding protein